MKSILYYTFAVLLLTACTKPERRICSQEVTFEGTHICFGYLLKKADGTYLRTVQYDENSNFLPMLSNSQIGDRFIVSYTKPEQFFDCAVEDTMRSVPVKLRCLSTADAGRKY